MHLLQAGIAAAVGFIPVALSAAASSNVTSSPVGNTAGRYQRVLLACNACLWTGSRQAVTGPRLCDPDVLAGGSLASRLPFYCVGGPRPPSPDYVLSAGAIPISLQQKKSIS